MKTVVWGLALVASCLAASLSPAAQSQSFTLTLTGQAMIRSDVRVHTPEIVSTLAPLLRGDAVFTNYEATVGEKASSGDRGFLSPPESLDALKALGFNLLALANNHSFDVKLPGIQSTLREAGRLNLTHAGIGNTIDEAAGAGYLRTPTGTVALIAMASGFVPEGGAATASRPGVNELRVDGGKMPNAEDAQRILQSIRTARDRAGCRPSG